ECAKDVFFSLGRDGRSGSHPPVCLPSDSPRYIHSVLGGPYSLPAVSFVLCGGVATPLRGLIKSPRLVGLPQTAKKRKDAAVRLRAADNRFHGPPFTHRSAIAVPPEASSCAVPHYPHSRRLFCRRI